MEKKCKNCGEVHKPHSIKAVAEAISESVEILGYEIPFIVIAKDENAEEIINYSMKDLEEILFNLFLKDSGAMAVGKSALLKAMLKK